MILVSQAFDLHTVKIAAYYRVPIGAIPAFGGPLIMVEAAPP